MFIRDAYNYNRNEVSYKTAYFSDEKGLTQQHLKEEADINTIVRRFGLTGQLPTNVRIPQYGDFRGITDYQTALNSVIAANQSFAKLPARIRERFNNNPEEFVTFCLDVKNKDEAVKLGLVKEPAATAAGTPAKQPAGIADTPKEGSN